MGGLVGLNPYLAAAAQGGIAPRAACGLHEQAEQTFGCPEVAAEERAVRIDRGYQRDAPKVVALGNHLGTNQDVHLARVHGGQLRFELAFEAGGVRVDAGDAQRLAARRTRCHGARAFDIGQQLGQVFFQLLGAPAEGRDVHIAAVRAGAWHPLGEAAVVAAQGAVYLVKDPERTAMRALAFPAAVVAREHGSVAAPVQKHHALLAARHAFLDGLQERE